ncbi:hypothetical protein EDB80DRAFT_577873 [Ilyonectria destructans]|nr:hypothetical protein EDB80DRAFT_577873 [Ilyonectria destructans]
MSVTPSVSLTSLPLETVTHIVSLLPRFALLPLRCVNRQLGFIATTYAFRSLRLQAYGNSPGHFIAIAESEKLSLLVREVTCDTWIGPEFEYRTSEGFKIPAEFLTALPFLGSLRNLRALHLRFHQNCTSPSSYRGDVEETVDFRYRILDTLFQCLAGTWSNQRQRKLDQSFGHSVFAGHQSTQTPATKITQPPSLTTLTISNLADFNDPRLTTSDAFKTILGSGSLTDMRLYITTETSGSRRGWNSSYPEKFDMFESLPATWLSPVASNLRTLSLYSRDFWGWHPKANFRLIDSLPQLKVLALGKYTFSHQWQVDWVASLGLEELYLDDCHILYQALCPMPMDHSTEVIGKDDKGDDIVISNEGYIRRDIERSQGPDKRIKKVEFPLRWHTIFSHWRKSMLSLTVFKIGPDVDAAVLRHAFEHNAFRYFDCPAPGSSGDKYRHGTGMSKVYRLEFLYVYKMDGEWVGWAEWIEWKRRYGEGGEWEFEDDLQAKDEAALSLLMSTTEGRRISHVVT